MIRSVWASSLTAELGALGVAAAIAVSGCNSSPGSLLPPTPPPSSGAMFVTDFNNNSIAAWGQGANCNCAPTLLIRGANTGMSGPIGIAADAGGHLYVANSSVGTITKYPGGGNGNISPTFAIGGLNSPYGVAVDGSDKLYVTNSASSGTGVMSVQVYTAGSTQPAQTITGAATGLSTPGFVALDRSGNIWVANVTGNSIEEFPPTATGNIAPSAVISGSNTLLSSPQGIGFDLSGRLYVAINNPVGVSDAVLVFSPPLNGNIAPSNVLCGPNTAINNPTGLALNGSGTLFVVNSAFAGAPGYLTIFAANNIGGGTSCLGPLPNAAVGGASSTLVNPTGIALR